MCYGYSSWFGKARAKELGKAQEKVDALNKERAPPAPATEIKKPAKPVEEREKVSA
jgi:hypothetical protein